MNKQLDSQIYIHSGIKHLTNLSEGHLIDYEELKKLGRLATSRLENYYFSFCARDW